MQLLVLCWQLFGIALRPRSVLPSLEQTILMCASIFDPASVIFPYVQNQSCDPFTPEAKPCTLGNYVSYAIKVTSADDVIAGVRFAQENNVRLVIKNTGHE